MRTKHCMDRMNQRGINAETVEILRLFGRDGQRNCISLTSKNCEQISRFVIRLISLLEQDSSEDCNRDEMEHLKTCLFSLSASPSEDRDLAPSFGSQA